MPPHLRAVPHYHGTISHGRRPLGRLRPVPPLMYRETREQMVPPDLGVARALAVRADGPLDLDPDAGSWDDYIGLSAKEQGALSNAVAEAYSDEVASAVEQGIYIGLIAARMKEDE